MQPFKELLSTDRILVVDGAMGTMLYAKGVYINRCYDELNLSNPDLVREIHTEYIRAGADIIETNTFGATAHKLQQYGLEANLHEINAIAAKVAREAAGNRAYVAGAIGPLGLRIEPYGPTSFDEARDLFKAQAIALLEGGVDLFCLETFSDVSEIRQAIAAVRELCDLPIIAQMTIMTDGNTMFGTTPELFTERLDEWGADVIGLNCGVGPAIILTALEKMRGLAAEAVTRFGVRDVASGRAGSANEWIEIPKLTPGEVSLSSLHIGERSATPITAASINDSNQHEDVSLSVDHRFESSSHLRFVVFVYNAAQAADSKPDVALQILITRDNQPVITTPLKKVTSEGFPDLSRIPYAAEISLAGLTSGRYVLKVNVVDRVSKRSASQETKIEID